jgi:hypothetical protein
MVDAVTTQVLENGSRWLVMKFTSISDGTGETAVKKVDAQSQTYAVNIQGQLLVPGVHLKLREIQWSVEGMKLLLLWDATVPVTMMALQGNGSGLDRFDRVGGLPNPQAPGATGSILFTTLDAALNSTYSVVLRMSKGVPNGPF